MTQWQERARQLVELGRLTEAAALLAKGGDLDGAAKLYLRAKAIEPAAHCLVQLKRYAEAGELLIGSVPTGRLSHGGALKPQERRAVLNAATCFARAGSIDRALRLFLALGEQQRAVDLLRRNGREADAQKLLSRGGRERSAANAAATEAARQLEASGQQAAAAAAYERSGHPLEAGRVQAGMGNYEDAARLFLRGGDGPRAGDCYLALGRKHDALKAWSRTSRRDRRYRRVVERLVELAAELGHFDFDLDQFAGDFLQGEHSREDIGTLLALARLYQTHGFEESTALAARAALGLEPGHAEAAALLARAEKGMRASPDSIERVLEEDLSFHGADRAAARERRERIRGSLTPVDELPDLPDLPDLPELPDLPPRTGGTQRQAAAPEPPPPEPVAAEPPSPEPSAAGGPSFVPGAVVAERYRLVSELGAGGMATVFQAQDEVLDERVALKVFKQVVEDPDAVARFKRELKLSRQLVHPNVLRVYDFGTFAGASFMTMEILSGEDMAERIERHAEPLALERILDWLAQSARGLHEAHRRGIVHRDVKPQNIFLVDPDPAGEPKTVKVMDFGVARSDSAPKLSRTGTIVGTPEYMAPEQIQGMEVGPTADIYSLGIVAYELLCRDVPFTASELMALLMMHLREAPPPLSDRAHAVPPDVEEKVAHMMAKDPTCRPQDSAALAAELEALRDKYRGVALSF